MRTRIAGLVAALALLAFAYVGPGLRRRFIQDIITWDAPPSATAQLAKAAGDGLTSAPRVRVVLIDGLSAQTARTLPTWSALCKRGMALTVDVGFPTVSLPVQVSLWTGLTQQQTGVLFRSDRPLVPPLDRRGIPARVLGSHAVAESHGYIVRSLGFSVTEPEASERAAKDRDPDAWKQVWQEHAIAAVRSAARLAFVHILRVDTWGHRKGGHSAEYATAAAEADRIVAQLVAADPDARWFLLSDHGHLPAGGHGGEDREVRQVQHCIIGPGIAPGTGGPVHLVDISRALADSLGLTLDRHSLGRPLAAAVKAPLSGDQALPPLGLGRGVLAIALLVLGIAATVLAVAWRARLWWLAPVWFVAAWLLLVIVRGWPSMSMPMVYGKDDLFDLLDFGKRLMTRSWLLVLPLATVATWLGLARGAPMWRVLVAQLALPFATFAAALTACGGWGPLLGAEVSPMVPHYTAIASPLFLITSQGAAAVALAVLVRTALPASGRSPATGTTRSAS